MQTLEVAIGLVAYFMLMSMVASAIVDIIEAKVRKKGRNLLKAVRTACGGGESFTTALYAHPRVEILYEGEEAETGTAVEDKNTLKEFLRFAASTKGLPAYIPNETFARAFLETLTDCKVEELGDLKALFAQERRPWKIRCERSRAEQAKEGVVGKAKEKAGELLLQLEGVATPQWIPSGELDDAYRIMRPIVIEADGEVNKTLALLADHFEKVNERSKGWYKRWVTKCLLVIGLLIAAGTNGDSVRIVGRLNADPALRESMLKLAESLDRQGVLPSQAGAVADAQAANPEKTTQPGSVPSQAPMGREQILKDLRTSEAISGGWTNDPVFDRSVGTWGGFMGWLLKIIGLGVTGAAISLGAPFWFHILQSLLKLRGALKGKDEGAGDDDAEKPSPEEAKEAVEQVAQSSASPVKVAALAEVKRAVEFAKCADLAYRGKAEFEAGISKDGAPDSVDFLSETGRFDRGDGVLVSVDTQAYAVRRGGRLVVAFRGTEPRVPADLITDAKFQPVIASWIPDERGVLVHGGFNAALEAVWGKLRLQWLPAEGRTAPAEVIFCGHSLGGALAVLAAARFLAENPGGREQFGGLFTIGQPRVGNATFATWAARRFAGRYVRAVNNRDAVPRVPPAAVEHYMHFGTVHYFDASGTLWVDPGWFYRFLDYTLPETEVSRAKGPEWISMLKEAGTDHSSADYAALYERNCGA